MTRLRSAVLASVVVALALAIFETSPAHLVNLNWDNGSYVADLATSGSFLAHPWSAHFAIAPLYSAFARLAHVFHGTVFDGVRLATIVVFVIGAWLLADLVAKITQSALATIGLSTLFCTVWVNQFLLLTVEDNLLYVPLLLVIFRIAFLHEAHLRRRDAIVIGAIAGLAYMLSLQAMLYAFPAVWLCLLARPAQGDHASARAQNVALCVLGGVLAVGGVLVVMSLGRADLKTLATALVTPPNPPLRMRAPSDWLGAFDALGWAAGLSIDHSGYAAPPTFGLTRTNLGLAFFVVVAIYAAWLGRRAWRDRSITLALVAVTLLFFTIATPLRIDDGYAYLKRFDFLPTCLVLSLALVARRARVLGVIALVIACGQLGLGLRWAHAHRAGYAPLACPPPAVHPIEASYGRDGKSWVEYFKDLRHEHPNACVFVFDLDELSEGTWWQEVPGALWSELPNHVALGMHSRAHDWRYPPHIGDPRREDPHPWTQPCAVLSCAAKKKLSLPNP